VSKNYRLKVEDGDLLGTLGGFFRRLLEEKVVSAIMVPREEPWGKSTVQSLVWEPEKLAGSNPLAPVLPINSARLVAELTFRRPGEKIGVVLRPCEARTLNELVKLQQATLDDLLVIGIDCYGTYGVKDFMEAVEQESGKAVTEAFLKGVTNGGDGVGPLRTACTMCEHTAAEWGDIRIKLFGADLEQEVIVEAAEEVGEALGLEEGEPEGRSAKINAIVEKRTAERNRIFAEIREKTNTLPALLDTLSKCIRCYNCREVCPICYCKECTFKMPAFDYDPGQYLRWSQRKGLIKMPVDTLLFHMTRMNHMVSSCTGCGMCEEACPNDIPVARMFRAVGSKVQEIFDYVPGRSLEEELPLATFKEEELEPR
jgi:formate dehydrogenase subunit beta